MAKIEVLVKNLTTIGEGPHYDDGFLYYVDIIGNSVGRYDTRSGKNVFMKVVRLQLAKRIRINESMTLILPNSQLYLFPSNCRSLVGLTSAS